MIFVFAGEQSGDQLGAKLIHALKQKRPQLNFEGVGGPQMRQEGLEILLKMEEFQVMGFSDVFKAIFRLLGHLRQICKHILKTQPEAVILIDYAEFNIRLAKQLRKKGYQGKIIHYVSPSVWAWRKKRAHTLAQNLDLLLSILPFEKAFYEKTNLNVAYVGHPLVNAIERHQHDPGFTLQENTIALFPGSRRSEIELNLPLQLASAKGHNIAISVAREELKPLIEKLAPEARLVPHQYRYELMKKAKAALATCGTVTLELALHKTPTIVTYKLGTLNYLIAKILGIKLPYYNLANIIANEEIFPEFVHKSLNHNEIRNSLEQLLQQRHLVSKKCHKVSSTLTGFDANQMAAEAVLSLITKI